MKSRTMKRRLLPRAILAVILLALPAAADAPRDQYERYDGDSLTIKDTFTLLEWDRKGVFKSTWDSAFGNCALLSSFKSTPPGRLPTVKELLTIVDEEPHQEYEFGNLVPKMIDANAFASADTPVDAPYWTSTPAGTDAFWTVSFKTGLMAAQPRTAQANARCVR